MLGRGRFIPGKAAALRRQSQDYPDDESRAEGVNHGTATLLSGLGGGLSLDGKSVDPTPPQKMVSRKPPEKTKSNANVVVTNNRKQHSMLSPNAAQLLCPAGLHADEIEVNGVDDVSSMNDSIYFGGGASVTGGYARRRNPSRPSPRATSLGRSVDRAAPGASPEVPINLLGVHDSDVHSVESGDGNPPSPLTDVEQPTGNTPPITPPRNAEFAVVDIDYAMEHKHKNQRDGTNTAISPTSAVVSASSNDESPKNQSSRCCCCCKTPGWIQRAPYWLKLVLVASIALLLAAIALVAVGLLLASNNKDGTLSLSASSSQAQGSATSVVTLAPTPTITSTITVSTAKQNSTAQTPPGPGEDDKLMVVYLTVGQYSDTLKQQAGTELSNFPTREGASFMVHLGDWNDPSVNCTEKSYQAESDFFHSSSIPVYFVMGANDANGCSDPTAASALWKKYLSQYESKFWQPPPWKVDRQGDISPEFKNLSENFRFAYGQAAFVSIDVVNGAVNNGTNVQLRQQANTAWIQSAYELYNKSAVSTIFILANDGPPGAPQNSQFYMDLLAKIKTDYAAKDFVLVHRAQTPNWVHLEQYEGIPNLDVVTVLGPIWPTLRMTVDFHQPQRKITVEDTW